MKRGKSFVMIDPILTYISFDCVIGRVYIAVEKRQITKELHDRVFEARSKLAAVIQTITLSKKKLNTEKAKKSGTDNLLITNLTRELDDLKPVYYELKLRFEQVCREVYVAWSNTQLDAMVEPLPPPVVVRPEKKPTPIDDIDIEIVLGDDKRSLAIVEKEIMKLTSQTVPRDDQFYSIHKRLRRDTHCGEYEPDWSTTNLLTMEMIRNAELQLFGKPVCASDAEVRFISTACEEWMARGLAGLVEDARHRSKTLGCTKPTITVSDARSLIREFINY